MTFKRLLTAAAVLALLVFAGPAVAQDLGGGTAAPTAAPDASSAVATTAAPEAPAVPAPEAEPAQDDTPTTPEGEEQPPDTETDGEQTPTEDDDGTENGTAGDTGGGTAGGLPRTGMGLIALTMIGFGLLLAGGALWPTSSWPPPRDRLSRSTPRR
jgi:hypothetical protein